MTNAPNPSGLPPRPQVNFPPRPGVPGAPVAPGGRPVINIPGGKLPPLTPKLPPMGPAGGGKQSAEDERDRMKHELHMKLIAAIDLSRIGTMDENQLRKEIKQAAETLIGKQAELLNFAEKEALIEEVMFDVFGLGPLEKLLRDKSISDIMINGPRVIFVERKGRMEKSEVKFRDEPHLLQIIQKICARVGRRVDETSPMVDARLQDGSRVNAIIPPLALDGSLVSIRKFPEGRLLADDLINYGSITPEMIEFLAACVKARMNILISGGTGSGKTTLLNMLSGYIQDEHRVATIEDAAELRLQQPHVVRMETRAANLEGKGEITARDLVRNAMRMRPDRIVVGECRGGEALDMLQAMNTGHDGCLTTIHSNTTRDAMGRLEMLVGMSGLGLPIWIIRQQIVSAVGLVVQAARLAGGVRRITQISEITGMEGEVISMQDIFLFVQTGLDENGKTQGYFLATGNRPKCIDKLAGAGYKLPVDMFERRILGKKPAPPPAK